MKTSKVLIIIILISFSRILNAQEKYDFMIIEYTSLNGIIGTSLNGVEFKKERVDPKFNPSGYNANPLLSKVHEWQEKEWEVMNFDVAMISSNETYFAFLRKKRVEKK